MRLARTSCLFADMLTSRGERHLCLTSTPSTSGSHQELLGLSDPMTLQRAFSERFFLCLYKGLRKFVMISVISLSSLEQSSW